MTAYPLDILSPVPYCSHLYLDTPLWCKLFPSGMPPLHMIKGKRKPARAWQLTPRVYKIAGNQELYHTGLLKTSFPYIPPWNFRGFLHGDINQGQNPSGDSQSKAKSLGQQGPFSIVFLCSISQVLNWTIHQIHLRSFKAL